MNPQGYAGRASGHGVRGEAVKLKVSQSLDFKRGANPIINVWQASQ